MSHHTIFAKGLVLSTFVACGGSGAVVEHEGAQLPDVAQTNWKPEYPEAKRQDVEDTLHGQVVADPYRWLENPKSESVAEWTGANDKLARKVLSELPEREALKKRFKELLYRDEISIPYKRGDSYFYSRRHQDKEKRIVYIKTGDNEKVFARSQRHE